MYSFSHHAPTPDEFAELVAESLMNRGSAGGQMVFDRQGFALLIKDGFGRPNKQIFLSRLYREYCHSDVQTREKILLQASGVTSSRVLNLKGQDSKLVPRLLDRWSVEKMRLEFVGAKPGLNADSEKALPCRILAEHFAVLLAASDTPENKVFVTDAQLTESQTTFDDALRAAVKNLAAKGSFQFDSLEHADTDEAILHSTNWNEEADAAKILMSEKIESLSVPGHHLIFVSQNGIIVIGTESERALMYAYSEVRNAQKDPRPLPPFPVLLKNGEYSRYHVSSKSLWHHLYRQMELRYLSNVCRWQKELLTRQYTNLIAGCRVAQYDLAKNDAGRMFSYCAVEERFGPTMLPKTDFIYFQNRNGRAASGSLARIRFMFPELLEETDFYPTRFLMTQFPSAEQLAAIGLHEMFE